MTSTEGCVARAANVRNNAAHQPLRFDRWRSVRDSAWQLLNPLLPDGSTICLVGAGSCDDLPLSRLANRCTHIDFIDFDLASTNRACARLTPNHRARIRVIEDDVTGGSADLVLQAARDDTPLPTGLPLPFDPLGSGGYDLVVGDMLYTQLLHAGLIALKLPMLRQRELMARYDPPLTHALVQRLQASARPGGHVIHIHDLACWSSAHDQPCELRHVLEDPFNRWSDLRRHDACDPHLVLERSHANIVSVSWWEWPFEPNKRFLVRASVARSAAGSGSSIGNVFQRS